jgi:polyisoprenoid-binding protein YceI
LIIGGGIIGVFVVVGAAALYWYLNQPVPEEVSLEGAVADIATTDSSSQSSTTSEAVEIGVEGIWVVDTSIGDFSFEDATSSFAGFRIDEELASIGATTAVGRTPSVEGSLTLAGTTVTETTFTADLSAIVTNASRRDSAVQRALDTGAFPIATFTLTEPIDLGTIPGEGVALSVNAVGTLEIKGVSQPVEIPLETQVVGDLIVVVGAVDITFADWGVEMPSSPGVVSVEDHGILEMQLFLTRG